MPELPAIAHVTLTVSDLSRTVPWYERLLDAEMTWDDTPGPFRRVVWLVEGKTLVGFHQFGDPADSPSFDERRLGLDHLALPAVTEQKWSSGRPVWMSSALPTGASSTLPTVRPCPFVIQTTSHSSSSRRPRNASSGGADINLGQGQAARCGDRVPPVMPDRLR